MPLLVLGLAALAAVELCASGMWMPAYFRHGIPLYARTFFYLKQPGAPLSDDVLSAEFKRALLPSAVFQSLGPGEIAFREKMLQLTLINYTPVMHGIIREDGLRKMVTVQGYANWWPMGFIVAWLCSSFSCLRLDATELIFSWAVLLIIFAGCYAMQLPLFNRIFARVKKHYGTK